MSKKELYEYFEYNESLLGDESVNAALRGYIYFIVGIAGACLVAGIFTGVMFLALDYGIVIAESMFLPTLLLYIVLFSIGVGFLEGYISQINKERKEAAK